MDIIAKEAQYTSGVYYKRDVAIVRGEGALVWDQDGRAYIDCVGGHGVAIVGHSNPDVVAAVQRQAERLITCPEVFYNDIRAELLEELIRVAPGDLDRAYLCSSGTEAVEAAIKFARISTGRIGVVATKRGFHGRTLGALSATWEPKYRRGYEPLVPGFAHVTYNDVDELEAAVTSKTAAVILELVQGEGGVNPATQAFADAARRVCDANGALLIVDEVQTGLGRTGAMFASERYGVQPDLMALAKALAGGLPMGATLLGPRVTGLESGVHGSTFGGNPLCSAAALATLRYIQEHDLPARAARLGERALARLAAIDNILIKEVRGLGLMIGIDLRKRSTPYLKALMDRGVMALPAGSTVVRLLPPLVITEEQLDTACDTIEEVLSA
ncbi:MAG: aspartate aminotransferase family protein [Anaerolineae bacterium]